MGLRAWAGGFQVKVGGSALRGLIGLRLEYFDAAPNPKKCPKP